MLGFCDYVGAGVVLMNSIPGLTGTGQVCGVSADVALCPGPFEFTSRADLESS
jgi:hypothetical protein